MKKRICLLTSAVFLYGVTIFAQEGESANNRSGQTLRIGQKTGIHLMYSTSTPIVLDFPGEVWTMGGEGDDGRVGDVVAEAKVNGGEVAAVGGESRDGRVGDVGAKAEINGGGVGR